MLPKILLVQRMMSLLLVRASHPMSHNLFLLFLFVSCNGAEKRMYAVQGFRFKVLPYTEHSSLRGVDGSAMSWS